MRDWQVTRSLCLEASPLKSGPSHPRMYLCRCHGATYQEKLNVLLTVSVNLNNGESGSSSCLMSSSRLELGVLVHKEASTCKTRLYLSDSPAGCPIWVVILAFASASFCAKCYKSFRGTNTYGIDNLPGGAHSCLASLTAHQYLLLLFGSCCWTQRFCDMQATLCAGEIWTFA
jgi:hypothetical protein